ncbi:MAG: hypothetical protein AB8B59_01160 [Maribacter sp.]
MIFSKQILYILFIFSVLFFRYSKVNAQNKIKDSLIDQIQRYRSEGEQSVQSKNFVDLLNKLAKNYRFRHADSIKMLSDEAYLIASKINYPKGKAFALLGKGDFHSDSGLEQKAYKLYEESKELAFSLNFPELKVDVLKSLAFQDYISQNLYQAVLRYYEAIDLASKNNLYELEARLRHNLGYCYSNNKLYDEAQIEYLIADSLWNKVKPSNHLKAMTISNIALNSIDKGDLEFGNRYNNKSINLLEGKGDKLWLSRAFRVKARYFLNKQEFKSAQKWILKSDSLLKIVNNPRDQMEVDILSSKILVKLGDFNNAKEYSYKVLEKAQAIKDSFFLIKSYENLEKIEEFLNHPDIAYEYYKKKNTNQNTIE